MQGLEPQQVRDKDVISWFIQSVQLMQRKFLSYLIAVVLFFASLYFISHAMQSVVHVVPDIVLLISFLILSAFIFYFFIAGLVMVSYSADHSQPITVHNIFHHFSLAQGAFLKMTMITIAAGLFAWYASVLMNPETDLLSMSEKTIALLTHENTIIHYIFKTEAVYLYFVLVVMFLLRTFFSTPLVIFHNLNYDDAKKLSHKAIMKNIKPMGHVLIAWCIIFLIAIVFAPSLAIVLMPLFCTFGYVAYRHIFLGQGKNKVVVEHHVTA